MIPSDESLRVKRKLFFMKFLVIRGGFTPEESLISRLQSRLEKNLEMRMAESLSEADEFIQSGEYLPDMVIMDFHHQNEQDLLAAKKIKNRLKLKDQFVYFFAIIDQVKKFENPLFFEVADDFLEKPVDFNHFYARVFLAEKNLKVIKENLNFSQQLMDTSMINDRLIDHLMEAVHQISISLGNAIQFKDITTGFHTLRVGYLADMLADQMKVASAAEKIKYAGFFHDIGKIGIPDEILKKPGSLTQEEFSYIKKHPDIGADILKPINFFMEIIEGIRFHHERWDGRGYPEGLKADSIPIIARIISVADVFDVIISPRPYKKAVSMEEAYEELLKNSGTQFDPSVIEAFKELFLAGKIKALYDSVEKNPQGQMVF